MPKGLLRDEMNAPALAEPALSHLNLAWCQLRLAQSELGHARRNLAEAEANFGAERMKAERLLGCSLAGGWDTRTGRPLIAPDQAPTVPNA